MRYGTISGWLLKFTARVLLPFFLGLTLFCSCATRYRPLKNKTGYSDTPIASNQFRVSFKGNGDTPLERTYDFALLRSAEVAEAHSFSHFAVIDVVNTSSASRYQIWQLDMPDASGLREMTWYNSTTPLLSSGYYYNPFPFRPMHEETRIFFEPGTILTIQCFQSKPEKVFTYDASEIRKQLKQKYRL
jgi:hypothetical protein